MTTKEFSTFVAEQSRDDLDLNYAVIALNEEAGEVAGWYKKAVLRGNLVGLTRDDLKGELGDVLYYLTRLAQLNGWSLEEIMDFNKAKLLTRRGKGLRQIV